MDKFQSILIFSTVAEKGGFTAAADKLNMSPSTVTKNVAALESQLGVQLFHRTTRRIALTDLGRDYYERCSAIIQQMDEAEEAMRSRNTAPEGRVRLVMPYSFGRVTFVPELPAFRQRFPGIELDVNFSDAPVDIIQEGFDLALLVRDLADSRLVCRTLHRGPEVTVASPDYLAANGTPETPADLAAHRCIIGNFGDKWHFQAPEGAPLQVQVQGDLTLRSGDALREAAVAGLGLARSTWWLFRKDSEAGRLISVLDGFARPGFPISVIYPARRLPRKTVAVLDFLTEITRPSNVGLAEKP